MIVKRKSVKHRVDWGKVPKMVNVCSHIMLISFIMVFVGILGMLWVPSLYMSFVIKFTLSFLLIGLVTRHIVSEEVYEFDDDVKEEYRRE